MTLIVAARFESWESAGIAANHLNEKGIPDEALHTFYVNAPGAHDQFSVGGDQTADVDARGAQFGAVAGAAVLGLAGASTFALLSLTFDASVYIIILAAGIGAYLGSLIGALRVAGRKRARTFVDPLGAAYRATTHQPARDVGEGESRTAAADIKAGYTPIRHAGVLLAVHGEASNQAMIVQILREAGGVDVERAQGRWSEGRWTDFDPVKPPELTNL